MGWPISERASVSLVNERLLLANLAAGTGRLDWVDEARFGLEVDSIELERVAIEPASSPNGSESSRWAASRLSDSLSALAAAAVKAEVEAVGSWRSC